MTPSATRSLCIVRSIRPSQPRLGRGGGWSDLRRLKGKAKRDEDAGEGASNHPVKKKNKQRHEGTLDHFEKLLEGPCPNNSFPIKHLYKDCGLMKRFFSGGYNKGEHRKDPKPAMDNTKVKDDSFPTLDGCLMIFGGSAAYDSKHC